MVSYASWNYAEFVCTREDLQNFESDWFERATGSKVTIFVREWQSVKVSGKKCFHLEWYLARPSKYANIHALVDRQW